MEFPDPVPVTWTDLNNQQTMLVEHLRRLEAKIDGLAHACGFIATGRQLEEFAPHNSK